MDSMNDGTGTGTGNGEYGYELVDGDGVDYDSNDLYNNFDHMGRKNMSGGMKSARKRSIESVSVLKKRGRPPKLPKLIHHQQQQHHLYHQQQLQQQKQYQPQPQPPPSLQQQTEGIVATANASVIATAIDDHSITILPPSITSSTTSTGRAEEAPET
jgi:hypothetical protein